MHRGFFWPSTRLHSEHPGGISPMMLPTTHTALSIAPSLLFTLVLSTPTRCSPVESSGNADICTMKITSMQCHITVFSDNSLPASWHRTFRTASLNAYTFHLVSGNVSIHQFFTIPPHVRLDRFSEGMLMMTRHLQDRKSIRRALQW